MRWQARPSLWRGPVRHLRAAASSTAAACFMRHSRGEAQLPPIHRDRRGDRGPAESSPNPKPRPGPSSSSRPHTGGDVGGEASASMFHDAALPSRRTTTRDAPNANRGRRRDGASVAASRDHDFAPEKDSRGARGAARTNALWADPRGEAGASPVIEIPAPPAHSESGQSPAPHTSPGLHSVRSAGGKSHSYRSSGHASTSFASTPRSIPPLSASRSRRRSSASRMAKVVEKYRSSLGVSRLRVPDEVLDADDVDLRVRSRDLLLMPPAPLPFAHRRGRFSSTINASIVSWNGQRDGSSTAASPTLALSPQVRPAPPLRASPARASSCERPPFRRGHIRAAGCRGPPG